MHMQAHVSEQILGQVPNQVGQQLPGLPHHNYSPILSEHSGGFHGTCSMDSNLEATRTCIRDLIYKKFVHQHSQSEMHSSIKNLVKHLEECLFEAATSKEEYMNMETLDHRLHILSRSIPTRRQVQHFRSSSSTIGTMIPTPGMSHDGSLNSTSTSSIKNSVIDTCGNSKLLPNTFSSGNHLPNANGSTGAVHGIPLDRSDGSLYNGYEQSAALISAGSGGNVIPSVVQRVSSQMIPTPWLSTSQMSINPEPSYNGGRLSGVEPTTLSKQYISDQNNHAFPSFGDHVGVGMRSALQQDLSSFGFPNGSLNGGLGLIGNNMQRVNVTAATDSYLTASPYGDGTGLNMGELVESGNLYVIAPPTGFTMNSQNYNPVSVQSQLKRNSHFIADEENLQATKQTTHVKPQMFDHAPPQPLQKFQQNQLLQNSHLSLSQQHENKQNQQCQHMPDEALHEQHVQEAFCQRIRGQDEARRPYQSSEGSITGYATTSRSTVASNTNSTVFGRGKATCEQQIYMKRKWLLFLVHARRCSASEGKCPEVHCINVQKLLKHMKICSYSAVQQCPYPRCSETRVLVDHHKSCRSIECQVCVPVRRYLQSRKVRPCSVSETGVLNSKNGPLKDHDARDAVELPSKTSQPTDETLVDPRSLVKRMKVEHPSPSITVKIESPPASIPSMELPHVSQDAPNQVSVGAFVPLSVKTEAAEMKVMPPLVSGLGCPVIDEIKKDESVDSNGAKLFIDHCIPSGSSVLAKLEDMEVEKGINQVKPEVKQEFSVLPSEHIAATKLGKPKIQGVSLTELFTPEQIREHIISLRQWIGQSKAKAEKNQAMEYSMSESACQLCAVEKLTFEPPPIYCMPCGARIKRNTMYYTIGAGDTRYSFCIPCYNESHGDTIEVEGAAILKVRFEKRRNDEETEEWWVQCDKCEAWQHQICALFNGRRNDGGQAEYTCPNCCIREVEKGERKPLPQSSVLGAKDLPRTILSDHIEQRLFRRLRQERQERARVQGKSFTEVPGAEGLIVRVVSSVDKKLEVKQRFLEIFKEENYPAEFSYKSKVVLLFQKIGGVEVCLFGMYVQEFGSECKAPNHRRVYLSYLDSVKYFRPEIKTVSGEALRTFVYHEILIGYLEYCKKRGFASCYIWACPPLKGEDYILYCHPEIQKTPKSDKLREWYLSMLRKAAKEDIVVDLTNLYDHFFVSSGECKAKITAARLPYFDGDYWPGAAEDIINQLLKEEDGRRQQVKGKTKKVMTKRALKAVGQTDFSGNASKDILLMKKLGGTICAMKEDFIMVHLQHPCTHCRQLIVSGNRWVCNQCKKFQLCDKCHDADGILDEKDRHPIHSRDKHAFYLAEVMDVPADTKDSDENLESEFFDSRQAFLSLCQGNHYQYDTLRRAKHSSMMVLYHLHNPTAPAFVTTCNVCNNDIEAGHGWRCEICIDYDVCHACYQKDGGLDHPHKLTNHPSMANCDAQNQEARQQRVLQLKKMLELLGHASQCRSPNCSYLNCRKVKGLFRHGMQCKIRASGGCGLCKKMWNILQLHARACKESHCHVPRCKDLKEHIRRLQQQSDSRRRAAVMEMMRQRAAEVAGNSG